MAVSSNLPEVGFRVAIDALIAQSNHRSRNLISIRKFNSLEAYFSDSIQTSQVGYVRRFTHADRPRTSIPRSEYCRFGHNSVFHVAGPHPSLLFLLWKFVEVLGVAIPLFAGCAFHLAPTRVRLFSWLQRQITQTSTHRRIKCFAIIDETDTV